MNFDDLDKLIERMEKASLSEISYKDGEVDIKLKKEMQKEMVQTPAQPAPAAQSAEKPAAAESGPAEKEGVLVKAPMVGTFYKAPSPESDPFVGVGDKVSNDSVVCILEAMKLFNEIQAETSGEIAEILVEDGEMVEYDQPLFRIV
ncbi:acetyl-CoA carboxylase biotin carboxyl carrier protein [Lacicoccus alkaliphilus]|uniref:Biotin carboxyl carrier protein of acetyl-CoA carboxylase n=1 Tax=Lacicoccus alkaliphilus DSM 16010 TaxID=1123231 RepID=A0A1M7BGC1_9BACL|nr:acetyl-CoA carboxylase biotin carboxyl carrier protein [Salinicoccus alkaliphilus]SHL54030.1 acetyl-CoA carboxylase biotin carboxyl carrier protein [Salinicoccus alkaliphilus DSM 16010]